MLASFVNHIYVMVPLIGSNGIRRLLISTLLLYSNALFSTPVKIDNALDFFVLERFFHMMTEESEYGYVLDGAKPISAAQFVFPAKVACPKTFRFLFDICAFEASEVWHRLFKGRSEIQLKVTQTFDQNDGEPFSEVLLINIPKLRKEIESNIDLFRYRLGASLGVDALVNHIVESNDSLESILGGDRVLMGIVLGFGSYNSLMGSRAEFDNPIYVADLPPYTSYFDTLHPDMEPLRQKAILLSLINSRPHGFSQINRQLQPGMGFNSLQEETEFVQSQRSLPPKNLVNEKPMFIFGSYKNDQEELLFKRLQNSQKNIQEKIKKENFLEWFLTQITGEKPILNFPYEEEVRFPLEGDVERAVAKIIWNEYSQLLDRETVPEFVEAFCKKNPEDQHHHSSIRLPGALTGFKRARQNLSFADKKIEVLLDQNKNLKECIPNLLYYEQIKQGNAPEIEAPETVLLSYVIEDGQGNTFSASHNCWVKLSDTLPAFVHGIQKMKIGEKRKIYIHPALAYGVSTTLPPCALLIVSVTLHQVNCHTHYTPPSLSPSDLSWLHDQNLFLEVKRASDQLARSMGSNWGTWLSQSSEIDFLKVGAQLRNFVEAGDDSKQLVTEEEKSLCGHLFWNLIFLPSHLY